MREIFAHHEGTILNSSLFLGFFRFTVVAPAMLNAVDPFSKKMKTITITLAFSVVLIISACGQNFTNLDFESAYNLPGNPGENGEIVSATNALPDWSADGVPDIYYVSNFLGHSGGPGPELEGGSLALSGSYSVELTGDSSISQTGQVPVNAESLQFEAQGPGQGGSFGPSGFGVSLGGQFLPLSALSESSDYTVYGASIPAGMAGQTEALLFVCQGNGSGGVELDNIDFSPESIPEPGTAALIASGSFLLAWRRWKKA